MSLFFFLNLLRRFYYEKSSVMTKPTMSTMQSEIHSLEISTIFINYLLVFLIRERSSLIIIQYLIMFNSHSFYLILVVVHSLSVHLSALAFCGQLTISITPINTESLSTTCLSICSFWLLAFNLNALFIIPIDLDTPFNA